ncbi:formyltetrahydrofolate deformylase [Microbacterium sp. B2969]|uniref:Formyltetrahydrofolate deformylase n=1 Tax=Microbacterium alkaliflavum TaxID=3248839 RepID=A0ABW7QCD4_9MICO
MTLVSPVADTTSDNASRFVLTVSCPNRPGIVRAVTEFIDTRGCSIDEHQQFDDAGGGLFFLRTSFGGTESRRIDELRREFADEVANRHDMSFTLVAADRRPRIGVLVSKEGHCLNDLVYRWRAGDLGGELAVVISNHDILRPMGEAAGLPYLRIPVTAETKAEAERALRAAIDEHDLDVIVLARYMQVLSDEFCRDFRGRVINIHHSFLPGFKGARPYHQAFDRGVKYVGATAHYVTGDLDEGPIIEQEVIRVTHAYDAAGLARVGRDAEALALSRAVRWHCQNRVVLNGTRTVVFS